MSILVTGGTGFIGSKLARRLVERGEEVVIFDLFPRADRISDIINEVKLVPGDLKVWPEVLNVIRANRIEGIFHLGGMLSVACEASPWAAFEANVVGTMYVLEAARLFGVKRVVFASTAATYSLSIPPVVTEDSLQRPTSNYGVGKLYGELLGRFYRRKFGLDFRCIRYFQVMGPAATPPPATAHSYFMIQDVALGKPYVCRVSEETASPLTYFKDAVRAAEMLYDAPSESIKTVCYNVVGILHATSAGQLASSIKKFIPDANITFRPDERLMTAFKDILSVREVDDSQARKEWGWSPKYAELDTLVSDFIEEVRKRPHKWGLA